MSYNKIPHRIPVFCGMGDGRRVLTEHGLESYPTPILLNLMKGKP